MLFHETPKTQKALRDLAVLRQEAKQLAQEEDQLNELLEDLKDASAIPVQKRLNQIGWEWGRLRRQAAGIEARLVALRVEYYASQPTSLQASVN